MEMRVDRRTKLMTPQRTSSGPKLGKSIAADLEKRAEKKQREAQKSSSRLTFKSHFPVANKSKKEREKREDANADDKDAAKHEVHKLDLKVPGKSLGDDGFALLCDGLEKSLASCADLVLIDFNASENALTTHSLARLAPIIRQSNFNLQTLDLSKNNLKVTSVVEAQEWERFLTAFQDCMTLRRLDLSDNPSLGPWALEIFARVYNREHPVDPLPIAGTQSLMSLPDEETLSTSGDEKSEDGEQLQDDSDDLPRCANGKTLADTWDLGYRRGLKSLPYLTLINIGLTDTGALFLSYIVEQHHYPTQLITEINAPEATSQIRAYSQNVTLQGIDWDTKSKTLGKDGLHLLQCAEKQRAKNVQGDFDSITSSAYEIVRSADIPDHNGSKWVKKEKYMVVSDMILTLTLSRKSHASNRRSSLRSVHSIEYGMYDKADIGSARKKIQRNTIVQSGCGSVELWHAALNAIACSRRLYMIAPEPRNLSASTNLSTDSLDSEVQAKDMPEVDISGSIASLASFEDVRGSFYGMSLKNNLPPIEESQQSKRSYAATLMETSTHSSDEPILGITDVTNYPTIPTVHSGVKVLSAHRKDSATPEQQRKSGDGDSSKVFLQGTIERDDTPEPWTKYQVRHMQDLRGEHGGQSDGYCDPSLRCQLPLPVCLQIMGYAMDPHQLNILKDQQQRTACAWGQKHETLKTELDWRRKDESSRILMVLSAAECVDC